MALDLSALNGFTGYTSMMLAASKASRAAAAAAKAAGTGSNGSAVTVATPWDTSNAKSDSERLRAAMQATNVIDEHDSSFDKKGVPEDQKKLFTLYKALSTLQTLAESAAKKETASGLLPGLDRRFQQGFAQIMDYANGLTFDDLSLATGPKRTKAETDVSVARSNNTFTTKMLVQGDAQAAIPSLENASPFTIQVKRGNTTSNVTIDLAGMGTTTRNLGNVINFINGELKDAGVQSRLTRIELPSSAKTAGQSEPPKQYAMQIDTYGVEQLTFTASASEPALYMANEGVGTAEIRKLDVNGGDPTTVYRAAVDDDGTDLNVKNTVKDADGNVFVVGTTSANQGASQINQSSSQDVVIRKYDSAGNMLWSKLLGSTDKADGLGIATDSKGAVVVAGQITGKLGTGVSAGGLDSYVVKISATGEEVFARQFGSALDDGATAVAVGPDDSIYVGGNVKARIAGAAASNGGTDGYIVKFNAAGTRQYARQFGGTGDERVTALAVADDGNLVVATNEGGQGVVRKFSSADATSAQLWSQSIGDLAGGGNITGLALEGTSIYLAGSTTNSQLNGGANIARAHSGGGQDGFVAKLTDNGAGASTDMVTYVGTGAVDRINGIAVENGRIFVAGDTKGTLPGATATRADVFNAFAAELTSTGQIDWAKQFGVSTGEGYGRGLAVDMGGASVLDALGLPTGKLSAQQSRTLTSQTTVRPGDYFEIKIGDMAARKITIEAGETMTTLARKVNRVLFLDGKATVARVSGGEKLRIEPTAGETIELKSGNGHLDALKGLGLSPGRVTKPPAEDDEDAKVDEDAIPAYALGLKSSYSLGSTASASSAQAAIMSAMSEIRTAYRDLTMDPELKKLMNQKTETKGKQGGVVPAYLTAQLANYNAGLSRLNGGSSSTSSLF